jgi:hypothetical protein
MSADENRPDTRGSAESPWMARLGQKSRDAVQRNVATAPPLTDRQRERLRLLFRKNPPAPATDGQAGT